MSHQQHVQINAFKGQEHKNNAKKTKLMSGKINLVARELNI